MEHNRVIKKEYHEHTEMFLYFAFFNFALGPVGNSSLPNFIFRNFLFRIFRNSYIAIQLYAALFGHKRASYSSYGHHIKTV